VRIIRDKYGRKIDVGDILTNEDNIWKTGEVIRKNRQLGLLNFRGVFIGFKSLSTFGIEALEIKEKNPQPQTTDNRNLLELGYDFLKDLVFGKRPDMSTLDGIEKYMEGKKMNHGIAVWNFDEDIPLKDKENIKKGEVGVITAYLPKDNKFAVMFTDNRWITFNWSEEEFWEKFIVTLIDERLKEI